MLKILQAGLQQYVNCELQMFKLVLEKVDGPEVKLPTTAGSWKKHGNFRKKIYFCFIDFAKAFDCVDHTSLGIPDHLLRKLYTSQETTAKTGHEQWTG